VRAANPLVAAALLAGCAGAGDAPPRLDARLNESGDAVVLRMTGVAAGSELGTAELRLPERSVRGDGWTAPARRRDRAAPRVGVGAYGGSSSGVTPVISLSLPLFGWSGGAATQARTLRLPLPEGVPRETAVGRPVRVPVLRADGATSAVTAEVGAAK